jgi:hypothetical protein
MAKRTEIVMVKDGPWDRAVQVTITAPKIEGLQIEALAQRAWNSPRKKITEGELTVKVEAFGR